MNKMPVPKAAALIIDRLRESGHTADLVGGCVRDFLLGRVIGDYDITTSAQPLEIKSAFSDFRTVDTGIIHGTVTVMIDEVPYEVTTYRTDGEYKDNRHPESVTFTRTLSEDLSRRDFTVNAICYNPYDGYTDLFGGMRDLGLGILRTVGVAEQRFHEDALRIMRGMRFASVLGMRIEENTASAIHACRNLLGNIAKERLYSELMKLMGGDGAYAVLTEFSDVLEVIVPELNALVLPSAEAFLEADIKTRLGAIFMLSCTDAAADFDTAMRRLRSDNSTRITVERVLSAYNDVKMASEVDVALSLVEWGKDTLEGTVRLGRTLGRFTERDSELLDSVLHSGVPYTLSMLAIRGGDLEAVGIKGRAVGGVLKRLLRDVIVGESKNEIGALLERAHRISGILDC